MGKCLCVTPHYPEREITKQAYKANSKLNANPNDSSSITHPTHEHSNSNVYYSNTIDASPLELSPYELSKRLFNRLNEIRFNPSAYIDIANDYGLGALMTKASSMTIKPEPIIWSESKYNILSNFDIKDTAIQLLTKSKYTPTVIKHISNKTSNIDAIIWDILASLSIREGDIELNKKILLGNYQHCVISAFKTNCDQSHNNDNDNNISIEIVIIFLELINNV